MTTGMCSRVILKSITDNRFPPIHLPTHLEVIWKANGTKQLYQWECRMISSPLGGPELYTLHHSHFDIDNFRTCNFPTVLYTGVTLHVQLQCWSRTSYLPWWDCVEQKHHPSIFDTAKQTLRSFLYKFGSKSAQAFLFKTLPNKEFCGWEKTMGGHF